MAAEIQKLLEKAGIQTGERVVDFGCGSGRYSIAAAGLVGKEGRVYAFEKDAEKLRKLSDRAHMLGLHNIVEMDTGGRSEIDLSSRSVHTVLLFDVLHHYYFPRAKQRERLLDEVFRVLKDKGVLMVFPTHMDAQSLSKEVERRGFCLKSKHTGRMVHNEESTEGSILVFAKSLRSRRQPQRVGGKLLSQGET